MPKQGCKVYLCDPDDYKILYTFETMAQAAKALGISRQAVQEAFLKQRKAKGYFVVTPSTHEQLTK